jgi:hypothetical protein
MLSRVRTHAVPRILIDKSSMKKYCNLKYNNLCTTLDLWLRKKLQKVYLVLDIFENSNLDPKGPEVLKSCIRPMQEQSFRRQVVVWALV